jgi:hypothetical protein
MKKILTPKLKTVLFCSGYNLFAEMTVRGFTGLFQGLLPVFLFFHYFSYFYIIIHFIGKSKGYGMAILAVATTYAWFVMILETGLAFIWGVISWIIFIPIIFIGEWAILQTILPLYISGTYFGWKISNTRLSKVGWILCIGYLALFCIFSFPGAIKGSPWLYILSLIAFGINIFLARKLLLKGGKKPPLTRKNNQNQPSRFLLIWFILTISIGSISGLIFPFFFEPIITGEGREIIYIQSFIIMTLWSLISGITILSWKFKKRMSENNVFFNFITKQT